MRERGAILLGDKGKRRRSFGGRLVRRTRNLGIAVLAAGCVAWSIGSMEEQTRISQAQIDISRIGHAARLFRADFGRCPTSIHELKSPPEGNAYLDAVEDPWGHPYQLRCPARRDPGGVDVSSAGPDGNFAGEDNISSL